MAEDTAGTSITTPPARTVVPADLTGHAELPDPGRRQNDGPALARLRQAVLRQIKNVPQEPALPTPERQDPVVGEAVGRTAQESFRADSPPSRTRKGTNWRAWASSRKRRCP
ncbi:hypothetical protein GCM10010329_77360 [Streptomyces spiroverticillatus]|uniref:Uncharacterized protein n=1 Tax=Streptomyces finlayi TaxID=67296 RepID=A0A918X6E3_9ACTN|nr:hypothetical protein GCM10010329_77360 [Streptomyces spiroverticillatus]GHD13958.1 hypothetical protein GCM10010334_72770 [Streptomyces finlayi]